MYRARQFYVAAWESGEHSSIIIIYPRNHPVVPTPVFLNDPPLTRSMQCFHRRFNRTPASANAAANVASSLLLASLDPPRYDDLPPSPLTATKPPPPPSLHPRIAVLLGVNASWHVPLLTARALSTAPAMWWGLRCAFTFLGDLLLSDGMGDPGDPWTVEKRFRVTEVFLAILWVCCVPPSD